MFERIMPPLNVCNNQNRPLNRYMAYWMSVYFRLLHPVWPNAYVCSYFKLKILALKNWLSNKLQIKSLHSISSQSHRQKAFSIFHFPLLLSIEESYSVAVPQRDQSLSRGVGGCQLIMKLSIEDLWLSAVLITLAVLSST